jgi:predicted regulator of Ras-like GTPase activity (Roadblock/LC7/MglB family)
MAVPAAFSDLMEISSQVETAIVVDGDAIVASSLAEQGPSEQFAAAIRRLVEAAEQTRASVKQIEVALPEGHLFVVREGAQLIGAATSPDPPSGLVFYDLRACLSALRAETAEKRDAAQ